MFATRPSWRDAPAELAAGVQRVCGASIVGSRDVHGGMSPGPAAVLRLADGRRVFVKAVSRAVSEPSHRFYQREAVALAALPVETPAPVLLGSIEVTTEGVIRIAAAAKGAREAAGAARPETGGEGAGAADIACGADGWFALVMSVAEGVPAGPPWTGDGVGLVRDACEVIGALPAPDVVPPIGQILTDLDGWELLAAGDPALLDGWERQNVAALAELAARWQGWTAGTALVHQDVRADNAIVDLVARRAVLVDWSFGCAGAPWLDRARLAADIVGAGHRDGPAAALRAATKILDALPGDAARFVAALGGMWRYRSTLAAPPGHPTLRPWQRERARLIRPLLATLL
ncbi:aminoglycoside phosphotransferase family protein [Actinoplanes sp. TRM 88003]|uniref:Aminoglycoside phosphotransferase family protein n=1 Tax=Paractinoplanes aksuensis TaxID=2939490 RepID=A0ABT1E1W6_9ACTN|nr:aminoglycoside phosphotransferase family protein [Actinoplanes aksuensis]MCO8277128.1 aminoglycoside phosphotransferase family protein [Actinoplanes aksuensis]